jgi:signal transduction histidine kinase
MTSSKKELLDKAYDTLQQLVWYDYPVDKTRDVVVEDVMGYGTNIDEKILDFNGFRKLVVDQREQSMGADINFESTPVLRRITKDENVAVFVDEYKITMIVNGDKNEIPLRVSWLLEFRDNRWLLIHWHASRAVDIEGDTWQKDLYKKKNEELQKKVDEKTAELKKSLDDLKAAQSQLIQSEKMASLGELTAGIAHEIQNPLNFVNNFSEVNKELLVEMDEGIEKGNFAEIKDIVKNIISNEEKISHHGKRADAIVRGMLQHSRSSSGIKEPALCDEYLRLSYHGLRAKDNTFNSTLSTDYDKTIGTLNIIPQDIGRVILNLINNAFYAVKEKKAQLADGYVPTISVSTKRSGDKVLISIKDNGNGIPHNILDKIFQPFFTTKPTGQGTGLGLSLRVETKDGDGAEFTINLPYRYQ